MPNLTVAMCKRVLPFLPLVACATSAMQIPPEVATNAEVITVTQRSLKIRTPGEENFNLGPYRVSKVDRKAIEAKTMTLGPWTSQKVKGVYTFEFSTDTAKGNGQCFIEPAPESGKDRMACGCGNGAAEGWATLDKWTDAGYTGQFGTRDHSGDVRSIQDLEGGGKNPAPAGFAMKGEKGSAAVEVLMPGRVLLAPGLSENAKMDFACLSAALMLYRPIAE